jgi:hypothetical protein
MAETLPTDAMQERRLRKRGRSALRKADRFMRLSLATDHEGRQVRLFQIAQEASAESAEHLQKANQIRDQWRS